MSPVGTYTRSGLVALVMRRADDGPDYTGRMAEVTLVHVVDVGGNVIGKATTRRGLVRILNRRSDWVRTRSIRALPTDLAGKDARFYDDAECGSVFEDEVDS